MTEFTSPIKQLPYSSATVFNVLSDLNNLEKVKDQIPHDKIQDFSFDSDSCTFNINPVGSVRFSVVEREPGKTIKFKANQSPVDVFLWIQIKEVNPQDTRMKLTVKASLNPFLKPMLSAPIQNGLDKIADVLAAVPYETLGEKYKN
ncbi:MAG: SRPBCC family protein [Dysgonamonadaceae bacterium]|jgi:carbon monoxide dehydrogenase subunit G|nr:SRPBCC family protein [Dysgonamonadaceae bacterium]